mmetsp:Transcript_59843/g.129676  ORF Transcript_59843/g.129676 Transcript_59843/m.129676 type:complete len:409 (+) Transcript_59843:120-1346(+)|eukprot:CAMPEP_0170613408 /NCGR_PEP_ID=MMETSP0224-20130122/24257_1 /TAXON_ID=285029 /ORGANISM="Togula jolla, Strain CCCM 725" /LENGTH=408 /DNA_ID=CAMNT_0010939009 /DNA_START=119 /DNA_END=1345 /DNA_ORIENTATION=-
MPVDRRAFRGQLQQDRLGIRQDSEENGASVQRGRRGRGRGRSERGRGGSAKSGSIGRKVKAETETSSNGAQADKSCNGRKSSSSRDARLTQLASKLASPEVQLPLPGIVKEEAERLTKEEVGDIFKEHVPGVSGFLYREQHRVFSLNFIKEAYFTGIRKFQETELEDHFKWLLRVIVHHAADGGVGAAGYLKEVAEAFMDCQDIQARVIERVGFLILGVTLDFKGHLVRLTDEYKTLAMKMVVASLIEERGGLDDWLNDPVHLENHILAAIGEDLGMNQADLRRAMLDGHAQERHDPLDEKARLKLIRAFHAKFDVDSLDALMKAFVAEVNSFSEESPADSMARQFLDWVSVSMADKHIVFDEDCTHVHVGDELALAIWEVLFCGQTHSEEIYRGQKLRELFKRDAEG